MVVAIFSPILGGFLTRPLIFDRANSKILASFSWFFLFVVDTLEDQKILIYTRALVGAGATGA